LSQKSASKRSRLFTNKSLATSDATSFEVTPEKIDDTKTKDIRSKSEKKTQSPPKWFSGRRSQSANPLPTCADAFHTNGRGADAFIADAGRDDEASTRMEEEEQNSRNELKGQPRHVLLLVFVKEIIEIVEDLILYTSFAFSVTSFTKLF
jgi:hypothetical protein